jgi:signal transduction histidine kinase
VMARTAELVRSRQGVVAASDAARHRLERDIHDGAQQELVALLIRIRALAATGGAGSTAELRSVRDTVEHARGVIRDLANGGRPAVLVAGGLPAALEAAVESARRTGLTIDLRCGLDSRPPDDVELAVYFCCVEALQNTAKHAHARQVAVSVEVRDGEIVLTVRDDGVGFDATAVTAGSGLSGLLERMAAVGGVVTVESRPLEGTVTTCRAPLPLASDQVEVLV